MVANTKAPKVFISYTWEDDIKPWVLAFAKRLRKDGVETVLDQWETEYGDQLPEFMERAVRASDFVILICTPKYKKKSDEREGGVGYEGHIITAEIFEKSNHRKFIPVLRKGIWALAAPSWAAGKLYIDLRANPYSEENYRDLLRTLHGKKPTPPPIGLPPEFPDEDEESPNNTNSLINFFSRFTEAFVASFDKLKLFLAKAKPSLRIAGLTGIAAALLWASSWAVPQVLALLPTPRASITSSPTNATAPSSSPVSSTRTVEPSPTLTEVLAPTSTAITSTTPVPTLGIGSSLVSEKDGMIMVYVPEGNFAMGTDNGYAHERPAHEVFLNAFWIDRTEVTMGQYYSCIQSGECGYPVYRGGGKSYLSDLNYAEYPISDITWDNANAYCQWSGRRLPTEAEWEKAARGTEEFMYPWGNDNPSCRLANIQDCVTFNPNSGYLTFSPVGTYEEGVSPYGALDMIGNVWEWVADWYDETYYAQSPKANPSGPVTGKYRLLRGGSAQQVARSVTRFWQAPNNAFIYYGFRCAKDANP